MRLLADESVDGLVIAALRAEGHDAVSIAETSARLGDDRVLDAANADSRLCLTADRDFGTLVYWQRRSALGVALVRLPGLAMAEKVRLVVSVPGSCGGQLLGGFSVISREAVRIRRLTVEPSGGSPCPTS